MLLSSLEVGPSIHVSRRTLLRWAAFSAAAGQVTLEPLAMSSRRSSVLGQEGKAGSRELAPLNRFSRMVQEWFVAQVRQAEDTIKERLAGLKTKPDAEAYVRSVQE